MPGRLTLMNRLALTVLTGAGAIVLAVFWSVMAGSVDITMLQVVDVLTGSSPNATASQIIWQIRIPRILAALGTGAALAVAGAMLQALLRNPLADPYILGMSGGAAVGALSLSMLLGVVNTAMGAVIGAIVSTALVFLLGMKALRSPVSGSAAGNHTGVALILIRVVIAAACGAMISVMLIFLPDQSMRGMLIWLIGDLSGGRSVSALWLILLLSVPVILWLAPALNLIATGELRAQSLGVPVVRRRWQIVLLAAVLTAAAVHVAGTIGFVGLVVPHLLRLVIGNDQRVLLVASLLFGAAFLLVADTLSRTLFAPTQLPVGAATAVIGVPVFLWLLLRAGPARGQSVSTAVSK